MSSNVYELINSLIQSTDLLCTGQQLIEFANTVYQEKNRVTIVKCFFEWLYKWAFINYSYKGPVNNKEGNYFICDEPNAARMYIALLISKKTTVKSITAIRKLGEFILSNFTVPVGECISEKSLENILLYLDKEYLFSSKIFSNRKAAFIRIHNTHKEYNSECLTANCDKGIINHFFLYHMKEKDSISPEAVLFHELGHAIHVQRFGDISKVPDDIIDILQNLCFPDLKQQDPIEQSELFADVLGTGLMYQTPFEKFDPYKEIHPDDKKAFKVLVEKIINQTGSIHPENALAPEL